MFEKIWNKTSALMIIFTILVIAIIFMNFYGIDVNDALMLVLGAMVKTFLDGQDLPQEKEINNELEARNEDEYEPETNFNGDKKVF